MPAGIRDVCREALSFVRLAAEELSSGRIPLDNIKSQVIGGDTPLPVTPGVDVVGDAESKTSEHSAESPSDSKGVLEFTDSEDHIGAWFPLLTGLLRAIQHPLEEQRQKAVDVLFDILVCNAPVFTKGFWTLVFKGVLFPIFADVAHLQAADVSTHTLEGKWLRTTCTQALSCLVGLFDVAFEEVEFMVFELLELLYKFVAQDVRELASIGINGIRQLLVRKIPLSVDAGVAAPEPAGGARKTKSKGEVESKSDDDESSDTDDDDEVDIDVKADEDDGGNSDDDSEEQPTQFDPYNLYAGPSLTREASGPKKRQTTLVFHSDRSAALLDCQPAARLSEEQWTHICQRLSDLLVDCIPTSDHRSTALQAAGSRSKRAPARTLSTEQKEQLLAVQSHIQLDLIGAVGAVYDCSMVNFTPAQHEVLLSAFFHPGLLAPLQQHPAGTPYVLDSKMTVAVKALATAVPALFRLHAIGEEKHAVLDIAMKYIKQPCEMMIREYNKLASRLGKFLRKRRRLQKAKKEAELAEMKKEEPKMRQVEKVVFAITPVLLKMLVGFQEMNVDEFHAHLPWLYPLIAELVRSENFDLRCTIQKILLRVFPLVTTALVEDTESLL